MSTSIAGKMIVILGASTGKFDSAMAKSGAKVDGLAGKVGTASAAIAKFGGVLSAGLIARGLKNMVVEQMAVIDKTGKLSDELGIATEDLLKFSHAAELTGTKQQTLTKGLQILVRRLGEAKAGWGEGAKGLGLLGLSADKLAAKSPADAMKDIADAIKTIPDPATRAAAAYSLFGRQGMELMNFLLAGRDGLEKMGDELERLGGLYGRIDASKVEEADDAITRMEKATGGLVTKLTIELAPAIESVAAMATDALVGMNTEIDKAGEKFGGLSDKILKVVDGLTMVWRLNQAIEKTIKFGWDNAGSIASPGNKFKEHGAKAKKHFGGIADDLLAELPSQRAARVAAQREADRKKKEEQDKNRLPNLLGPAASIGREYAGIAGNIFGEISKKFEGLGPVLGDVKNRFVGLAETMREDMKRGREMAEQFQTAGEKFAKTQADLDRLLGIGAIDKKTHGRGVAEARGDFLASSGLDFEKRLDPTAKFAETIEKINAMVDAGSITAEEARLAMENAKADMPGGPEHTGPNLADLAEAGSQAAYDAIVRTMGGGRDDPAVAEQRRTNALLEAANMRWAEIAAKLDFQLVEAR